MPPRDWSHYWGTAKDYAQQEAQVRRHIPVRKFNTERKPAPPEIADLIAERRARNGDSNRLMD